MYRVLTFTPTAVTLSRRTYATLAAAIAAANRVRVRLAVAYPGYTATYPVTAYVSPVVPPTGLTFTVTQRYTLRRPRGRTVLLGYAYAGPGTVTLAVPVVPRALPRYTRPGSVVTLTPHAVAERGRHD